jgi:hypothetical protein
LRKALGEDGELILIDFGRGYRFTATVLSTASAPECLPAPGAARPEWPRHRYGLARSARRMRPCQRTGSASRRTA